jgi:hypothetical protein
MNFRTTKSASSSLAFSNNRKVGEWVVADRGLAAVEASADWFQFARTAVFMR